jgi:hypothetical protein
VVYFPQFLSVAWVVGVETFSADADHRSLISARNESWHGVGFSLVDWNLIEVGRVLRLPGVLASRRLESDDILNIATVDVEHEDIANQNWRTCWSGPKFVIAIEIAS